MLLDRPGAPTVHGVELSFTMIQQARAAFADDLAAGRLCIHHASITALPLADSLLDGMIIVNTIYFINDLDQAFREFARTLKSSGRAVIAIGDPNAMENMSFTAHGFRLRPVADIETALDRPASHAHRTPPRRRGPHPRPRAPDNATTVQSRRALKIVSPRILERSNS